MKRSLRPKNRKYLFLRRFLYGWLVLLVGLAAMMLFLTTPPGEGLLRRLAEKRVGAATGWDLRIGTLETNLVGYVRVRDVMLSDTISGEGDSLLVMEEAAATYRLFDLLGKRPTLASVMIDGLRNDPVLIDRLSRLSGGEETDPPVWLRVNRVEIRNSELAYADSNIPFDVILGGFQTRVVRDADSYVYRVMMDSVSVRFEEHVFLGRFDAAGRAEADRIVADSLCLTLEGFEMDGSGNVGLSADIPTLAFSLKFRVDPSRLPHEMIDWLQEGRRPEGGTVAGTLRIGGDLERPWIEAHVRGTDVAFDEIGGVAFDVGARLTPEILTLERMNFFVFGGCVSGAGVMRWNRLFVEDVRLSVDSLDLQPFLSMLHDKDIPLAGRMSGRLTARGSLKDIGKWRAVAEGGLSSLRSGEREFGDLTLDGMLEDNTGRLTTFQADSRVHLDFRVEDGAVRGTVAAALPRIHVWSELLGVEEVYGRVRAEADFAFDGSGIAARGRVSGGSMIVHGIPVDTLAADLSFEKDSLYVRSATASGRYMAGTSGRMFDVEGFDGSFGYEARYAGSLKKGSGDLHAWVSRAVYKTSSLDTAALDVRFDDGRVSLENGYFRIDRGAEPIRDVFANVIVSDSLLIIDSLHGWVGALPFRVEGRLAHASDHFGLTAALNVQGVRVVELTCHTAGDSLTGRIALDALDLSLLAPWLPMPGRLEGRLRADLTLTGSMDDPDISGEVTGTGLGFRSKNVPLTLANGSFHAEFDRSKILLDFLNLPFAGGTFTARGSLVHEDFKLREMNLSLDADGMRMEEAKAYVLNLKSLRLSMKGDGEMNTLSGDIVLGETRWMRNVQPATFASNLRRQRPAAGSSSFLQRLRMDVRLRQSDRIWLDNNLGRVRLRAEMRLVGSVNRPALSGRLTAEEGYVFHMDRKLRLQRGIADFADPHRINPVLDISAEAKIRAIQTRSQTPYTVSLGVTGPADQAVVTLTSDPPLERGDIVALMTLGATRAQMTGGDASTRSGLGLVLRERAEQLTSGYLTGYAARRVGDLLGLETATIEGNLFRFGRNWGPQLLASKRLTNRMQITYSTTIGHANEQSIRLDYRLDKYFSFEGQTDQRGNAGIDLKYRIQLR